MTLISTSESPLQALSKNLAEIAAQVGRSVVAVQGRRFSSSGVAWREGVIVTSSESLKSEDNLIVTLPDNRTVPVTIVGRDPSTDVAILKLRDLELPVAEIGDSSALEVGHLVLAVGRTPEHGLAANLGVVSTAGGAWQSLSGGTIDRLIRLDLNLYSVGAGGALVDAAGRVVGFNTFGSRRSIIGIPATTVDRVVDQLLAKGRVSRGYLGLGMQSIRIPESLRQQLSLSTQQGVIVINIEPQGAAEQGGVLLGDILIALEDEPVKDTRDVQAFLGASSIGQSLKAKLIRGGELIELTLIVGER